MTSQQRARYFGELWPAACQAQGWGVGDETMRRDVTLEATGSQSTRGLDEDQITDLFRLLEHLADPLNVAKAIPAANPEVAREQNRCRQRIYAIRQLGFDDKYVARCADGLCAAHGKGCWTELPADALANLRFTVTTRARQRDAREGKRPEFVHRSVPYHQRPETKRRRAAARRQPVRPRPGVEIDGDLLPDPF